VISYRNIRYDKCRKFIYVAIRVLLVKLNSSKTKVLKSYTGARHYTAFNRELNKLGSKVEHQRLVSEPIGNV
jgi:hypothetical protein